MSREEASGKLKGRALARQAAKVNPLSDYVGRKSSPTRLCALLDAVADLPVISHACGKVGISKTSLKYWLLKSEKHDPGFEIEYKGERAWFHEHWRDALEVGVEKVETVAFKRALGYLEPLSFQGRVQYQLDPRLVALGFFGPEAYLLDDDGRPVPESIERQSEDLLQFILKARKPEIYRENKKLDVSVTGGVLVVGARAKSSEELEQRAKQMLEHPIDVEFVEVSEDENV